MRLDELFGVEVAAAFGGDHVFRGRAPPGTVNWAAEALGVEDGDAGALLRRCANSEIHAFAAGGGDASAATTRSPTLGPAAAAWAYETVGANVYVSNVQRSFPVLAAAGNYTVGTVEYTPTPDGTVRRALCQAWSLDLSILYSVHLETNSSFLTFLIGRAAGLEMAAAVASPWARPGLGCGGRGGRASDAARNVTCRFGVVHGASGSALAEQGGTRCLAAARGPRPGGEGVSKGRLVVEVRWSSFAHGKDGPRLGRDAERERKGAETVRAALAAAADLAAFPRATVDVAVTVLEDDGGDIAVAITAGALALADAGVPVRDLVVAVSAARDASGTVVLDPTRAELAGATGTVLLAMCCQRNEVAQLQLAGNWPGETALHATELCANGCRALDDVVRTAVVSLISALAGVE